MQQKSEQNYGIPLGAETLPINQCAWADKRYKLM